jgi:hypothetical protein
VIKRFFVLRNVTNRSLSACVISSCPSCIPPSLGSSRGHFYFAQRGHYHFAATVRAFVFLVYEIRTSDAFTKAPDVVYSPIVFPFVTNRSDPDTAMPRGSPNPETSDAFTVAPET